jgi:hypothetical protein
MLKLAAAILVVSPFGAALADQPPRLDVEKSCRAINEFAGAVRTFDDCMKSEQSALAELNKTWNEYLPADRRRCLSLTSIGGLPSYVETLVCLQMNRDAAQLPKSEQ